MRSIVGAVVLCLSVASSAVADDVVLRTGRTVSGKIVGEDDSKVVIETRGMKLSIAKTDVQEIRRAPPPKEEPPAPPAPPAPPPASKNPEGKKDATPPAKKPDPNKPPSQKPRALKMFAELEAIQLAPWQEGGTTHATDYTPGKPYKLIGLDGRTTMREERPSAPAGIAELYVLQDAEDGQAIVWIGGVRQFYWRRLFWHDDEKKWYVNAPELDAYFKDRAWADSVADMSCKDTNGLVGVAMAEDHLKAAVFKDKTSSCDKERAEVRKACAEATVSEEAGALMAQVVEMNVEAEVAKRCSEKIAVAMKRRDVIWRLVETMKD